MSALCAITIGGAVPESIMSKRKTKSVIHFHMDADWFINDMARVLAKWFWRMMDEGDLTRKTKAPQ
jgi:hypothetical protein